jgi:glyoxylase-like metal-dependent hydrolase (beta-lactamase superfamily II)
MPKHRRPKFLHFVAVLVLFLFVLPYSIPAPAQTSVATTKYEVYAVQYAVIPQFPVASLVTGADPTRRLDIAMMFWVIKGAGHIVLFDSGFYRDGLIQQWKPRDFVKPSDAAGRLGIQPEEVTDIILSHAHWDHAGGVELFRKARVWIQREEYQYYTGESWQADRGADLGTTEALHAANAKHGGIDPEDMIALVKTNLEGRLRFVNGDDQEVLPGIRCYTGGKHTFQSQYCSVNTRLGIVVLASDNMYLFENLEKHAAIAQTLDPLSNLREQDRMKQLAAKPELIVPGHDATVMQKFPKIANGIVRID